MLGVAEAHGRDVGGKAWPLILDRSDAEMMSIQL